MKVEINKETFEAIKNLQTFSLKASALVQFVALTNPEMGIISDDDLIKMGYATYLCDKFIKKNKEILDK